MTLVEKCVAGRWRPIPNDDLAAPALKVALDVANRLRDPARVEAAVVGAKLESNQPKAPQWASYGFAQGYAGLALLWGHLDRCFPDQGWDAIAHEHLEIAADGAMSAMNLSPGAFSGLAGLAFTAGYLSRSGTRYQRLISTLDTSLIRKLGSMVEELEGQRSGVPVNAFDVISGLSGIALYLLERRESAEADRALLALVRCLIDLSREEEQLPRLHSPAHFLDEYMLEQFPHGNLNCGLAHGIPGPLGALSLACQAGVECEGLEEAIDRLAAWLVAHRMDDNWGLNWPTAVGLLPPGDSVGRIAPVEASPWGQAGWCYGSPGIARTLYHAGIALHKEEYCNLALEAMYAVLRRPIEARRIDSPTFCHGVAGLLQIVLRFANDTGEPMLQAGAEALTQQLLKLYEPDSLLGFRSIEFAGRRVNQPGLLDGAPSVSLVLLSVACDIEPAWDRLFLLS
jgi:lantibiotic modifying enzyme